MDVLLQQVVNGLMLGGVYVMVAVAFTLVIGMLNFLNFTIPALFMVAAVMMWAAMAGGFGADIDAVLDDVLGAPNKWIAGVVIALAVVSLASLVIERFTYRYMKAKYGDATEHALPLVSSLGFLIAFEHLVIGRWGSDPLTIDSPFGNASFHLGAVQFSIPQVISLALSLAIVFGLSLMLRKTRLGRAVRSIAERPDTATLLGVDVGRI
ncbi:MAG: branched-chain amino acid ABC transporter permease, partial [Rhodospirillaceae bacterium]|nr:branched-chain amino acid ABC transporter permease [Rhodospirillaceae bacterium]